MSYIDDSTSPLEDTPLLSSSDFSNKERNTSFRKTVYAYAIIAAVGGFVCGYDTGSISSIVALPMFQKKFFTHGSLAYYESTLLTSYLITSMFGAFFSGYFCDSIGRKNSMLLSSCFLCLGILCELIGLNIHMLLVGRLVGGIGSGLMTNAIPLYQSEISPADIRGRLISIFSLLYSFGQMVGYFVTFWTSFFVTDWAWRIPWLAQLIVCTLFMMAVFTWLPCSPRWLISKGRDQEGLHVLSELHGLSSQHKVVQKEYLDIKMLIETEKKLGESSHNNYAELFKKPNLNRTMYSLFIGVATCFTGNAVISYYAPQIFKNAGLDNVSTSLALTGGIGLLSLIFTVFSLWWWIDLWGRRALFFTGSVIQTICMVLIGSMFYFFTTVTDDGNVIVYKTCARNIIIGCIYVFSASYAGTWNLANYVYTAEIFSLRCRARGLSLTYTVSWACGIIIVYCTPFFLAYSVSGVYLFFGVCSIFTIIGIRFIPETRGKSLEEIVFMFEQV